MKACALVHDVYVKCDMNAIHDILRVITLDGRALLACLCVAMPLPELTGNK
jgi:hypothetical protein